MRKQHLMIENYKIVTICRKGNKNIREMFTVCETTVTVFHVGGTYLP